jgi:hypothetical protein
MEDGQQHTVEKQVKILLNYLTTDGTQQNPHLKRKVEYDAKATANGSGLLYE